MAVIVITHDLGIVAEMSDEVAVMYAGRIVERGADGSASSRRPSIRTRGACCSSIPTPRARPRDEELVPIPGQPPSLINLPGGCSFHPRCPYVRPRHRTVDPALEALPDHARARRRVPAGVRRRGARCGASCEPASRPTRRAPRSRARRRRGADVSSNLVEVRDLVKHFPLSRGVFARRGEGAVHAVDGVSLDVREGETLGIVGETGLREEHDGARACCACSTRRAARSPSTASTSRRRRARSSSGCDARCR